METGIKTKKQGGKNSDKSQGKVYLILVEGEEYTFDHSPVAGREIMDAAGIPYSVGLLLLLEDGTQKQIGIDEMIELKPGRSIVRAPKFKRG